MNEFNVNAVAMCFDGADRVLPTYRWSLQPVITPHAAASAAAARKRRTGVAAATSVDGGNI